jgi:hypothetical protein
MVREILALMKYKDLNRATRTISMHSRLPGTGSSYSVECVTGGETQGEQSQRTYCDQVP